MIPGFAAAGAVGGSAAATGAIAGSAMLGNININYAKEDIAKMVIMTYASFVGLDGWNKTTDDMIFLPMQTLIIYQMPKK